MMSTNIELLEIDRIFELQSSHENLQHLKSTSYRERLIKIKKIERYLNNKNNINRLVDALYSDLRKPREESRSNEIIPVLLAITHLKKNLRSWMQCQKVGSPLAMIGFGSYVEYEPKGCVMIIAPWNFPFLVTLNPLIYAVAAGNAVMIKPSELAPSSSTLLKQIVGELFPENEVAVIEGDVEIATHLLSKPFHHIFFTGSPAVGKVVMKAAANHLTSVTLELGGKSPVIIDQTANIKLAAKKVAWGKTLNFGQSCVAPDYLIIHESKKVEFINAFLKSIDSFYNAGQTGMEKSPFLGRIVNSKNFIRVKRLMDDAVSKGAMMLPDYKFFENDNYIGPCIIDNANDDMLIMNEEIFAPALPIITFQELAEVPLLINKLPKPLALYIFSESNSNIRFIKNNTTAGGVVINDLMMTIINPNLPFGGVNNSGIGKSNGRHSFLEFSNSKGVLKKRIDSLFLVYPPYKKRFIDWLMRIARI